MNNQKMIIECYKDFCTSNEINEDSSESFEMYSLHLLNKKSNITCDELSNSIVGGGQDGGIDIFQIVVDEYVVSSDEDLENIKVSDNSTLKVVIGQSKNSPSFSEDVVNKIFITMEKIWDLNVQFDELETLFNYQLVESILWLRDFWQKSIVKGAKIELAFFYACIGDSILESEGFKSKKEMIIQQAKTNIPIADVRFDVYSASELLAFHSLRVDQKLELKFKEQPGTIDYDDKNIGYIGVVRLSDYYDFITERPGTLRETIFEENVRHYQGDVDVNIKIQDSLKTDFETDFWWLNNGITIIAEDVRPIAKTLHVEGVQIVNGLQTSYTIGKYYEKKEGDSRSILVKIVKSSDRVTIDKIISATNRQTAVNPALLRATDKTQRKLELFFEQKGYFYDRRKNYYKNQGKPINRIFSIQSTAQAIHAIINRKPSEARAKPTTLIKTKESYDEIFREVDFTAYLNCCLCVRKIEGLIKESDMDKQDRSLTRMFLHHLARVLVSHLVKKSHPNISDIVSISINTITKDTYTISSEFLMTSITEFIQSQKTKSYNSISKSGPFEEYLTNRLIGLFKGSEWI